MPYLPKSKISIRSTNGGELEYITTGISYVGSYIKTSDGRYYEGTSNTNFGEELQKAIDKSTAGKEKNFGNKKLVKKFNIINENTKKFLKDVATVPVDKPIPTEKEYDRGFFRRYFCKRINKKNYIEISKDTFQSLSSRDGKYDHNLYEIGSIQWDLTSPIAPQKNYIAIHTSPHNYRYLALLFPLLEEYVKFEFTDPIENLYTEGGELFLKQETYSTDQDVGIPDQNSNIMVDYIGDYHIHPDHGPMVGATHTDEPHDKLYYQHEIPTTRTGQPLADLVAEQDKIQCYKCITNIYYEDPQQLFPIEDHQVIQIEVSSIVGCSSDSYSTYDEAAFACSSKND